ncbi:MAG TPA: hypothetical protein VKJ07_25500 [Mycobacteriales bacterium]|nr:hypothetical protein [Mycobacteriales bacterium]
MPALELPTAVQALAEAHDTADSDTSDSPVGFGIDWTDQFDPFHRQADITWVYGLFLKVPTPMHAFADVQDTPCT